MGSPAFARAIGGCQLRPLGRISLVLCAAGCVAACTEIVDSAVESRYAQYNYSTDWAKNEAILLNIIRASEYQPLNFMSFQPYQGTASVTGSASSPSFITGPYRVSSQKQYTFGQGTLTGSASATGTVTVTTLDTQNFYQAVLAAVDFKDLYQFQGQGYPRELLFRLFAEYVSLKPVPGSRSPLSAIVYNDPADLKRCAWLPDDVVRHLYGPSPQEYQKRILLRGSCRIRVAFWIKFGSAHRSQPRGGVKQAERGRIEPDAKSNFGFGLGLKYCQNDNRRTTLLRYSTCVQRKVFYFANSDTGSKIIRDGAISSDLRRNRASRYLAIEFAEVCSTACEFG